MKFIGRPCTSTARGLGLALLSRFALVATSVLPPESCIGIARRGIRPRFQYCRAVRLPPRSANPQDDKPPRGALIVVAVGLIACIVAALATVGKGEGEWAHLEWVQSGTAPDSKTAAVPGGKGEMQLVDPHIRSTGTNVSGYSLFTAGSTLRISASSPIGGSHVLCSVKATKQ